MEQTLLRYGITAIVIIVVLALRFRSLNRSRPLKIGQLWIVPALYAAIVGVTFAELPPRGATGWLLCAAALAIGVALGWQRGRLMRIDVDPQTHAINQAASPFALLFIVVLILVRSGARALAAQSNWHVDPLLLTDVLLAMALGLIATQRLEMYLRANRLLAAARAQRSG